MGPMFRHERAQRGRLRQFSPRSAPKAVRSRRADDRRRDDCHAGGAADRASGIPPSSFTVTLNTLGEPEERPAYRDALVAFLTQHRDKLDEDSKRRLELNPLRVLDSKSPDVQALVAQAPVIHDHLSDASRARFARVRGADIAGCGARGGPAPRARPRLLHGHHLRVQGHGRRSGRAEHRVRGGPLRPLGRVARRAQDAGAGLRPGYRTGVAGDVRARERLRAAPGRLRGHVGPQRPRLRAAAGPPPAHGAASGVEVEHPRRQPEVASSSAPTSSGRAWPSLWERTRSRRGDCR